MPKNRFLPSLLVLVLLAAPTGVCRADLRLQLDRYRLQLNETLTLKLMSEGDAQGEPDFGPLTQDFDILNRSQSQVRSIVNGRVSHTRQWTLALSPKRTGRLSIPALALGGEHSDPATVEVVAAGAIGAGASPRPLFLRAEADATAPYVQQPFGYRVKVYFREQPQRAVLSEPVAEGATIEQLGEDRSYDEYVDGQRYQVIERRFQLIPQRSGTLRIQGPMLEAMLPDRSRAGRRDPFADLDEAFGGSFFQGFPSLSSSAYPRRRVVERVADEEIQVRPQPDAAGSPWLPATSVQISDEWTPSPPAFKVGEPVTRDLTITAQGTTAAQLPNLDLGTLDGLQVYPDQPHSEDLPGAEPTAIKGLKVALVPTRAGTLVLPEIRLPWWDVTTDSPRVAVVPARRIEVAAADPGPASAPPPSTPADVRTAPAASEPPRPERPAAGQPTPQVSLGGGDAGIWPWLTLAMLVVWLGTLFWWLRERRQRPAAPETPARRTGGANRLQPAARRAQETCASGDARAARTALIAWGQARWPEEPPKGLGELGARLADPAAEAVLEALDRAVYAPPGTGWDGSGAWRTLGPLLERAGATGSEVRPSSLPELYPQG